MLLVFLERIAPKRRRRTVAESSEDPALTRAAADASARMVDVLSVSDEPGQLASQPAASREASALRLAWKLLRERQRFTDRISSYGSPRTTGQDLTLPIASPSPRDTEVMKSDEVQLDLVPADSAPLGIIITGCGDQRKRTFVGPSHRAWSHKRSLFVGERVEARCNSSQS